MQKNQIKKKSNVLYGSMVLVNIKQGLVNIKYGFVNKKEGLVNEKKNFEIFLILIKLKY